MLNYEPIDIPFNHRHSCWFCAEPCDQQVQFPKTVSPYLAHVPLQLPACRECKLIALSCVTDSIWDLRLQVNHALMKRYAKHLGIGVNWTQQELQATTLEGTSFKGFTDSAWMMYEIAKGRVEFSGWPIAINGVPLDIIDDSYGYDFDGKRFIDFQAAVEFYQKSESLSKYLIDGLVSLLGQDRFAYALRVARLYPAIGKRMADEVLAEIGEQESDRAEILQQPRVLSGLRDVALESICSVTIAGEQVEPNTIGWAMRRNIRSLLELQQCEDAFFDEHQHLGGVIAFQRYHGLQLYLEARQDNRWAEQHDPNDSLWNQSH